MSVFIVVYKISMWINHARVFASQRLLTAKMYEMRSLEQQERNIVEGKKSAKTHKFQTGLSSLAIKMKQ